MNVQPIQPMQPADAISSVDALRPGQEQTGDFSRLLGDFVNEFERTQGQANEQIAQLAAGKLDNVHQVALAMSKAELSFNYMLEVRNRLIEAYREVMRIPV